MVRSTQRPITVWSNDRDLWTCLRCKHASVFNGKDFVDNSVVRAYYGVRPAQIPLIKAVYGDSSDHIKSSGSRMLRDNFVSILNSHGVKTISELAAVLPNIEPDLSARLQRVWPAIQRNYRLVRLRSKPDPKVIRQRGPSTPEALVALLETTGCKSLLRDLDRTWSLFVLPACA
jgi:5'-3' exonuclease